MRLEQYHVLLVLVFEMLYKAFAFAFFFFVLLCLQNVGNIIDEVENYPKSVKKILNY